MAKWEMLEEFLFENVPLGGQIGSNREIATRADISAEEASEWVRSYLDAQRSKKSRTLYVIHRGGRTSNAVWYSGIRTADSRAIGHQYFDDVRARFLRAIEPDLTRLAARNPRAARQCEAIVTAVGDGALKVLQAAVGGIDPNPDGGDE